MCAIIDDRIRINKIMSLALSIRLDCRSTNLDELAHLCVVALQVYYDGACPEECLQARARDFAAWHLARLGHDPRQANGDDDLHSVPPARPATAKLADR
jgi:hypothetical protein